MFCKRRCVLTALLSLTAAASSDADERRVLNSGTVSSYTVGLMRYIDHEGADESRLLRKGLVSPWSDKVFEMIRHGELPPAAPADWLPVEREMYDLFLAVVATFARVRELLEANDETGISALFANAPADLNSPREPYQIGGARLELRFPDGARPIRGTLKADGTLQVELENGRQISIETAMDDELLWFEGAGDAQLKLRPTWEWVGPQLEKWGVEAPARNWNRRRSGLGANSARRWAHWRLWFGGATSVFSSRRRWEKSKTRRKPPLRARGVSPIPIRLIFGKPTGATCRAFNCPTKVCSIFGISLCANRPGLTTPHGVAATLQGPWMEEYRLPPWSNDYHFNINLELIYLPALSTNRLEHFNPLWDMLREWMPKLRENGEQFFGRAGALMLPHAVDDRCQVVGTFWTGTIDHACTAWMAQLAWRHYRYGLDETTLKETAWPLLNGAFEGFWAMHDEIDGKFSLPVSVSPEYRGDTMNAWGRDASFQLAAWHMISQILPQAAAVLGETVDPRWREVEEKLPPYMLVNNRVGLWDGLELEESHRHHSHLAAIWPFASIDPWSDEHWPIVADSIRYWNEKGAGNWTGWCLPWDSILCSRLNLADAAVTWLGWMLDNFTNVGWGTGHNADFAGTFDFQRWFVVGTKARRRRNYADGRDDGIFERRHRTIGAKSAGGHPRFTGDSASLARVEFRRHSMRRRVSGRRERRRRQSCRSARAQRKGRDVAIASGPIRVGRTRNERGRKLGLARQITRNNAKFALLSVAI